MKIRTDFVTNSSSSSFTIVLNIKTKGGKKISFKAGDTENENYDVYRFKGNLGNLISKRSETPSFKPAYSELKSLAAFLMDAIENDDYDDYFDDEEDFDNGNYLDVQKQKFQKKIERTLTSVDDIARITVRRDYSGRGDGSEQIAFNDSVLCDLAQDVVNADGENKTEALEKFKNYINSSSSDRKGDEFCRDFDDIRYKFSDQDSRSLVRLAEKIIDDEEYGYSSSCGFEIQEIDLENGTITKYAEYSLDDI